MKKINKIERFPNALRYRCWRIAELIKTIRFNRHARGLYQRNAVQLHPPLSIRSPFFLAAVVMIRGEDDYILEWIEFHKMMGIEHFFVYHNGNGLERKTKTILGPYIDRGEVTYIVWPDIPSLRNEWTHRKTLSIQQLAYGHCTLSFRQNFTWLLKIDVDEFIYPRSNTYNNVKTVLRELPEGSVMSILVNRTEFGSSGHRIRPNGLIVENFTRESDQFDYFWTKALGLSKFMTNDRFSNAFDFRCNYWSWLRGKLIGSPRILAGQEANELFVINHYQTKSLEEYQRKYRINAQGYMSGTETEERFSKLDAKASKELNTGILRFLPQLKQRLSTISKKETYAIQDRILVDQE